MPEHTLHEAAGGASSSTTATIPFADHILAPESPLTRETVRGAERRFEGRCNGPMSPISAASMRCCCAATPAAPSAMAAVRSANRGGGRFAALSSGFIGIGGGLATTVGLSAVLDVPQRQAQMASLVLSLIPTTIPAAGVYWRAGAMGPWPALLAVILGLVAGTDLGRGSALGSEAGRFARRCSPSSRRWRHTWRAKRGSPLERITQSRCSCIVRE